MHDIISFQISVHVLSGQQMKHHCLKQTVPQTHTLPETTKQSLLRDGFFTSSHCHPLALLEGQVVKIWPGLFGFRAQWCLAMLHCLLLEGHQHAKGHLPCLQVPGQNSSTSLASWMCHVCHIIHVIDFFYFSANIPTLPPTWQQCDCQR